jgi:putative transposase
MEERASRNAYDQTLESLNITPVQIPPWSPDLNAYAERWVKSIKEECLNHFIVFGVSHMDRLAHGYADFYNTYRPHRSLNNKPLSEAAMSPPGDPPKARDIKCREFLGGWLKHYYRDAA